MTTTPEVTFGELVSSYLAERTPESLDRLRRAIRDDATFDTGLDLAAASESLRTGRAADAARDVSARMPGAFFSPSAHALLAAAFGALGDDARHERESALAAEALVSLRSTGDGTELSPWVVLRVSDEYDLLRAAGRRSVGQRLVDVAGVPCDRHELDDGSTVWFRLVA